MTRRIARWGRGLAWAAALAAPPLGAGPAAGQELFELAVTGDLDPELERSLGEVLEGSVETIAGDIGRNGFAARVVAVDPRASAADVAHLRALAAAPGRTGQVTLAPTREPLQVAVDLPPTVAQALFLDQGGDEGGCAAAGADWPFPVAAVAGVIRWNEAVLAEAGVARPSRAGILIVDSGLPPRLLDRPDFAPMLMGNPAEALGGGAYLVSTALDTACADPDGDPSSVAYGSVPTVETAKLCQGSDHVAATAPPVPVKPVHNYLPDHGGIAAALAAGGPALLGEDLGLDALLGLSFARIVRPSGGSIRSDVSDLVDAIAYAGRAEVDVMNLSLTLSASAPRNWVAALEAFLEGDGLIVAAAGNARRTLMLGLDSIPVALSGPDGHDRVVVVGGTHRGPGGGVELWPDSNRSPSLVDVAAPAAGVPSLDAEGGLACLPGTSVSAPQVSFVAGVLVAMGFVRPEEVKRRILATADHAPDLAPFVREGRVLHVARALDVFVDLVWTRGREGPVRGRILDDAGRPTGRLVQACDGAPGSTLEATEGWIDSRRLLYWDRRDDGTAEVWHERDAPTSRITPLNTTCRPGTSELRLVDLDTGALRVLPLAEVTRIVPSRFRVGEAALRLARREVLAHEGR